MHNWAPYIVLIDDDEDNLEMLSSGLALNGIKTKTFDASAKAVLYLTLMSGNKELPSLVIMDYNMPRGNGLQVLILIKGNKETMHIPVIMYSTGMSVVLKQQLLDAGAFACFIKPCTYSTFITQVETFKEFVDSFKANKSLA